MALPTIFANVGLRASVTWTQALAALVTARATAQNSQAPPSGGAAAGAGVEMGLLTQLGAVRPVGRLVIDLEAILREVPGTRSVYAERVAGGYFVDFVLRRDALARYGPTGLDDEAATALVLDAVPAVRMPRPLGRSLAQSPTYLMPFG